MCRGSIRRRMRSMNTAAPQQTTNVLNEIWRTRPVRLPSNQNSGAWLAGVAEGIAVRYQVSVVLVRLMFVALSFFAGLGALTYMALILILPRYTVPMCPAEAVFKGEKDERLSHDVTMGWIFGVLVAMSLIASLRNVEAKDIVAVAVLGLLAYLLHQRTPTPPENFYATAFTYEAPRYDSTSPFPSSSSDATSVEEEVASEKKEGPSDKGDDYTVAEGWEVHDDARLTPPSWDPLGAAPFAWNLPDPDEAADAENPYGAGADKKSAKKKGSMVGRVISGFFSLIITFAVIIAVVLMALFGWFPFKNNDDAATGPQTFDSFSTVKRVIPALDGSHEYRYWAANGSIDFASFAEEGVRGENIDGVVITLNSVMSNVDAWIPESTQGEEFTVTVECPRMIMSEGNCTHGEQFLVKGEKPAAGADDDSANAASDDNEVPNVTLRVKSTMSTVNIQQR